MTSSSAGGFSFGLGIGIAKDPYWTEYDNGKSFSKKGSGTSVDLKANTSTKIAVDVSDLDLDYANGHLEFRVYYTTGKNITLDKITTGDSGSGSSSSEKTGTENTKSGSYSFKDNKDGTATVSSTLCATLDDIDALLTLGTDEDEYLDEDGKSTWEEGDPINSKKISYGDFGLPTDSDAEIQIESFTFTIESKKDMETLMYGCGLNVEQASPADTEYVLGKNGYWYNDHGAEDIEDEDFEIEVGNGTTLSDCGKYVEAVWDVPKDVVPYTTAKPSDTVSFQYWYGDQDEVTLTAATDRKSVV